VTAKISGGRTLALIIDNQWLGWVAAQRSAHVQRLLKMQNPRIAEVNIDDIVDNRFIRKLDESGFFDRIYDSAGR
jgi:hypothetical protein